MLWSLASFCLVFHIVRSSSQNQDVAANSTCLPDGIPARDRKPLRLTNENLSLGIWNLNSASGQPDAPTAIFYVLVSEVLGYEVEIRSDDLAGDDGIWALNNVAGCRRASQTLEGYERVCEDTATRTHAVLGISLAGQMQNEFDDLQTDRAGGRLEDLTGMGLVIQSGIYVKRQTVVNAWKDRVFLDDYRTYNASREVHFQLHRFFAPISAFTGANLIPCQEWAVETFHTPDWAEDNRDFLSLRPECVGYWWPSGSCRDNISSCIPLITHSIDQFAHNAMTLMYQARILNMPVALGAADGYYRGSDFHRVVSSFDVLYFYWEPDVTFLDLQPVRLSLPATFNGLPVPQHEFWEPRIVISTELEWLAPDARDLLSKMRFSEEDIYEMMSYGLDEPPPEVGANNHSHSLQRPNQWLAGDALSGACRWIASNPKTWQQWIPSKVNCFPGQGLYSVGLQRWASDVASVIDECRVCDPGRFSSQILHVVIGDTALCSECGPGRIQPRFGGEVCQLCQPGTATADNGTTTCLKCSQGRYQDQSGSPECKPCPDGKTTVKGASQASECLCSDSFVELHGVCVPCSDGLSCKDGLASQLPGFWATPSDGGLSVFQCRDQLQCPGGAVGSCAYGRTGRACGSCLDDYAAEFDGTCAKCGHRSYWPIFLIFFGILVMIPMVVAAGIFMTRARRAALSIFMVSIIFGQVVVCLQALDAIYQLDITWVDPAKAILQSLAIFSFDLDFSCVLPAQDYVLQYVVQLVAYPVVLAVTFAVWVLMRWARPVSFNAFVNVHGLLLVALLTAITLALVRPLQCRGNPNGLFTIMSKPDIVCWQGGEHRTLMILASSGILAYPVAILASIAYLTRKYPIWLRSGGGIEVMERYRFLFARFRPERYYYGLILTLHNLMVAIIPAALVALPALQVGIMGMVICLRLIIQILLWPWRLDLANYNDLSLSAGLLILLLLASPLLTVDQGEALTFVGVLLTVVMLVLPLVAVLGASAVVFTRLRPQSKYDAFLCHHKAGAGALCRFFKIVARKYVNMNIFLDSDELDDLGRIFDVVRADTKCLVVVLTKELLHRMWCAGEITSAHKHKVPIVPLYCDGYSFPDKDGIDVIESVWTEEQRSTLASYGISMEDIKAAYFYVQKLKCFNLCRTWVLEEQEERILEIVESSRCSPLSRFRNPPSSVAGAKILVCTDLEPEAISTGLILQQMVQRLMRTSTFCLQCAEELMAAKASFVVFLLSRGALEDPHFALCLLNSRQRSLEIVTVNDGSFSFPTPDFTTEVEKGRHTLPGLSPNVGPLLAKAYQALLNILALPLTPHGSSGLLERQVAQICQRFGNLEDEPRKMNGADSKGVDEWALSADSSFALSEKEKKDSFQEVECQSAASVNTDELWNV